MGQAIVALAKAIDRLTLPLPTEAERVRDLASHQLERCKQFIVRLLSALAAGETMSRTGLSQALRSDVRMYIDTAVAELIADSLVSELGTEHTRAFDCVRGQPTSKRLDEWLTLGWPNETLR